MKPYVLFENWLVPKHLRTRDHIIEPVVLRFAWQSLYQSEHIYLMIHQQCVFEHKFSELQIGNDKLGKCKQFNVCL